MTEKRKYKAFLSYSHADEDVAKRLHQALEAYKIPADRRLEAGKTLSPIFRDRAELSASHSLPDTIRTALQQSEALIVLASPKAKESHWVNEEIRAFRDEYGDGRIFCALLEGTPETSFPTALTETGLEPLAADLSRQNFRLGVTQLAASLLNIGLDDLIRRDLKKLRRRVTAITSSALAALLVMGTLTWMAMSARQLAETRRQDAEGQIEFMITDLKDKLETVGRLEPLNVVGERAVAYYADYPLSQHDADALGRRARVFHMLGEVQDLQGDLDSARDYFDRAYVASAELLQRTPRNPDRIFDHSQSAFWVGYSHFNREDYGPATSAFEDYRDLVERLYDAEGETTRVTGERIYALTNLAEVARASGDRDLAANYLNQTVKARLRKLESDPSNIDMRISASNSLTGLGSVKLEAGDYEGALDDIKQAGELLSIHDSLKMDFKLQSQLLVNQRSYSNALLLAGSRQDAAEQLQRARITAERLTTLEPTNIDTRFEELQLDKLGFHLAFLNDELAVAEAISTKIISELSSASETLKGDYRFGSIQKSAQGFPLYLAILRADEEAQIREANILLKASEIESVEENALATYPTRLLSEYVLGKNIDIGPYCTSWDELSLVTRSALIMLSQPQTCSEMVMNHAHPDTVFRAAFTRLSTQP